MGLPCLSVPTTGAPIFRGVEHFLSIFHVVEISALFAFQFFGTLDVSVLALSAHRVRDIVPVNSLGCAYHIANVIGLARKIIHILRKPAADSRSRGSVHSEANRKGKYSTPKCAFTLWNVFVTEEWFRWLITTGLSKKLEGSGGGGDGDTYAYRL